MSAYFAGVKSNLFAGANPAPAKPTKPAAKVIKVRAHTRAAPAKKSKPKPAPQAKAPAPALNTASVRPAETSTVKRSAPHYPGEPVAGYTARNPFTKPSGGNPFGGKKPPLVKPPEKGLPGASRAPRPFYTDASTLRQKAGPTGQESTQWNAANVAAAHKMQVENYGKPGYVARSLVPGGLDQGGTTSVAGAIERGVGAASLALPGGGIGEAGVVALGLGKILRGARAVKDVVKTAPAAAHVTEEAAAVRGAMPGAKILRGKQEAGYSVERSKRVSAARVHLENPNLAPDLRVRLAKRELVGELPKINFQGFSELNDQSLQALQTHILDHPHLMPFQKIRASDALVNALAGKVPTRGEIVLLEHVFGKDTAAGLSGLARHPLKDTVLSVLNIPRSLMASFDLSAPFRQGLMVSTRHPTIFAHNFPSMIKAFGSENVYHGMLDEIRARPTYPLMMEAKLPITELGRDVGGREEQFASNYAEKLTGGKYGPVRASGRAYTGFLDKTRADVFDHLIKSAQAQGINVQDQEFLRSLGKYIGSATGRGDLGHFQEAGKVLNAVLFSPRLLASRLNFLNPLYYARLHPFARKEALRSAIQLAGTASVLVALASRIPGVKVETDPRNPDWGKIRIGNTRLDIGGGFQQELRFLAQLASGVAISSTTGKRLSLTSGGFGQPTRLDIAQRFFMGKESPIASLVTDWLRGSTQIGQPFSWQSAATARMTPLLAQDAHDIYKQQHGGMNGLMAAFAGYGIGSVGIGVQTYGPPAPKKKPTGSNGYFGDSGSAGGGSPYFSTPSSSGGSGYFGK